MARYDMFDWLLRRKKEDDPDASEPAVEVADSEPVKGDDETSLDRPPAHSSTVHSAPDPYSSLSPSGADQGPPEPHPPAAQPIDHEAATEAAAEAVADAGPVAAATAPEETQPAPPASAKTVPLQSANSRSGSPLRLKQLAVLSAPPPETAFSAGSAVAEAAGGQLRTGSIVSVRADGRRVLAFIEGIGRTRAYTLREDGSYRLEGAKGVTAPSLRLIQETGTS